MPIIATHEITPNTLFPPSDNLQVHCGLDSMVTHECRTAVGDPAPSNPIYLFERALQAPYLDIMERGFLVDQLSRQEAVAELSTRIGRLEILLNRLAMAGWGKPLNPRAHQQIKDFLYRALAFPEQFTWQKGIKKLSSNREALEKLEVYLHARPLVAIILGIRDLAKQREVFETELDYDPTGPRFRSSYNIAGTETGRPSSSPNAFGTGRNAQNIAPGLRYAFIADRGYKIGVVDFEQVEARDVGWFCGVLLGDWSFLDACESGDFHTNNAKLVWSELPWTGDPKLDRKIADRPFYREFSYRDMAKRGGHLSNYMGTAWTASRSLKVPQKIMEEFQSRYITGPNAAFPCIPRYWQWAIAQLQTVGSLTTPFGRQRHFFGRHTDAATWREAIAYMPQSTTADRTNLALWRVHRALQLRGPVQLLAQTYDSITFQYPESANEANIIGDVLELMRVELTEPGGRSYVVPGEAKVGWNWGNQVTLEDLQSDRNAGRKPRKLNMDGLVKWNAKSPDTRKRALGMQRLLT